MIYCAGKIENFAFAKSIGIGLVESAMNLTHSILYDKPDEVVFVGTCGAYDSTQPLLEIFETSSAANIELSFLQKQSYTPLDNFISDVSHETMQNKIPQNTKIVNSSNYISLDSTLAERLLKLGIAYENMEFFSVLQVAQAFNLKAIGIFCITNHIHANAQKQFLQNHKLAMQKLESYITAKLDSKVAR